MIGIAEDEPPTGAAAQLPPEEAEQPGTPPVLHPALAGAAWGSDGAPCPVDAATCPGTLAPAVGVMVR